MDRNANKKTIGEELERELLTKDDMKYFKKQHDAEDDVDEEINTTETHPSDEADNNKRVSKATKSIYYVTK